MIEKILRPLCIQIMLLKGSMDLHALRRNAENAKEVNERLLRKILKRNRNTEYGRKYDFAHIDSVVEYRRKVPFSVYEDYVPYIDRIYNKNEQNVLTDARVIGFARSSGSIGSPKIIPLTNPSVVIYTKYTVTRFLALAREQRKRQGIPLRRARGICALPRFITMSPYNLPSTNVADVAAKKFSLIYPFILNLPMSRQFLYDEIDNKYAEARFGLEDRDSLFLFSVFSKTIAELIEYIRDNWPMLCDDIEAGTINPSVPAKPEVLRYLKRQLRPNPESAAELRQEFEQGFDETILARIWPNMAVISTIGTSPAFEPFTQIVRNYTKGIALDYSIYGASEGLFAAAGRVDDAGQLMLPDSCFYEFIEQDEDGNGDENRLFLLDELEVGKKYEIIITNQAGFYRYRFGDVFEVLGYEGRCPVVNFAYRKGQLLNITGEKTNLAQMSEAVRRLGQQAGVPLPNWSVFIDRGTDKYRYGIMLETEDGRNLAALADTFEQILRDVNTSYLYYEGQDLIEPPVIYMLRPGTYAEWKQMKVDKGASPEQVKPVNILDTEEKTKFFFSRVDIRYSAEPVLQDAFMAT